MPRLIIGDTTGNTSRIWVRGEPYASVARLTVSGPGYSKTYTEALERDNFYIAVIEVDGLAPGLKYDCAVEFHERPPAAGGEAPEFTEFGGFRTAREGASAEELSFLFGSCNMHAAGIYMNPDKPFRRMLELVRAEQPDFLLFCGDQIYYDIPNFWKHPDVNEYRKKYLDAWGDCLPAKQLLASIPTYMILDDHEMVDNFSNDMDARKHLSTPEEIRRHSLQAYREFQHSHNPQSFGANKYYYQFNRGPFHFFVLDTRTERISNRSYLIDQEQLQAFTDWLLQNRQAIKFVVCSVPFVAEVTVSDDKWSGQPFRDQREQIMSVLLEHNIDNLVFLTGDMHHSYYAKLEIARKADNRKIVVHELMSSPINNRLRRDFNRQYNNGVEFHSQRYGLRYLTEIHQRDIYTAHQNCTLVRVTQNAIEWELYRTRDGFTGWMEGAGAVRKGRIRLN